jgi:rod shape-determining protein MreD
VNVWFRVLFPLFVGMGWLVLKTTLVGFLPTRVPTPDLILIVVVVFGFRYSLTHGGILSFFLGLMQDILTGGIIGLNALSKTVVFSFTQLVARRLYFPNFVSKIAMVFLGGLVDGLLVTFILLIGGDLRISSPFLLRFALLQVLFSGLLAPVVIIITTKILAFVERGKGDIHHHGLKTAGAGRTKTAI